MKKNREKSPKQRMNRDILIVTYIFVLIFVAIAAYYIYYVNVRSEEYIASTYNTRQDLQAERVLRGDILARDGTVLVTSNETGDGQERIYPYGGMYAQVLGYYGHGKAGVERVYNHYLWRCHVNMFEQIAHTARGELNEGDSVVTTLDPRLHRAGGQTGEGRRGRGAGSRDRRDPLHGFVAVLRPERDLPDLG